MKELYLLKYNEQGTLDVILPDPEMGLAGIYVTKLPIEIDEMMELSLVDELTDENNKKYYKLK